MPIASYFDRRARYYIERGIPVVKNDFISMASVAPMTTPPQYTQIVSKSAKKAVSLGLKQFQKTSLAQLDNNDYLEVTKSLEKALSTIEQREKTEGSHFAMTKHVLESAGLAAFNATQYIAQDNRVNKLCRSLVAIQIKLVRNSLILDSLAQKCHKRGVGIIVNDVPSIPFIEALNKGYEKLD